MSADGSMLITAWYSALQLAGLPGMPGTKRNVNALALREAWPSRERAGRGGGREYPLECLPHETQAALLAHSAPPSSARSFAAEDHSPPIVCTAGGAFYDLEALQARYDRATDTTKEEAQRKQRACLTVAHLVDQGSRLAAALNTAVVASGTPLGTLRTWYYSVCAQPREHWLVLLVDEYRGRTAFADCSVEAWDTFKADYLRLEAPAAEACYERLARSASQQGWIIPASARTLLRRVEREFSRAEITLRRKGEEALGRLFPAQVRDHSVFHALQAVNADGHTFDVFCQWPDGSIRRPVLVGWQDIYSGKILSYRVDQTEHSGLVRLSFGDLVEKFGIPEQATLDNGRAWASKDISGGTATRFRFKIRQEDPAGLLTQMGVQIHWATTYHGQAKPIERAWRDLCEHVAKHPACEGAYTGNKPTAKPENYGTRAIKLEAFMKVLDTEIAAHNARPDRRSAVCDGRSFDAVFNESYARATIRRASNAQRTLWMLAAEGVSLHQQSGAVSFMGNRYWIPALVQHAGEKSVIRFDPQRLHDGVHVYSLEGRHIGYAKCETAAGFNDLDRAREHARARHEFMRSTKKRAQAEVRMTAAKVAEQLPQVEAAPVPVRSNVVAPVFGKSVPLPESHGYDNFDRAMERLKA